MSDCRRLVVGITGATGSAYAVRLLEIARDVADLQTHLVVSSAGILNAHHELGVTRQRLHELADYAYGIGEVGACIASGSYRTAGMVIVPCSMRTLASVAIGLADNLMTRAADVTLKERRRLVLAVRETPFNLAHLRNMTAVTEMGAIVFPPLPALYHRPETIAEIIDHSAARLLELAGVDVPRASWQGLKSDTETGH